jgi:hypothetical protein
MLKAIPKSWLSWDYSIVDGSKQIADMDLSLWREKGQATVGDAVYSVYREGLGHGAFILESDGNMLARAEKPSAFLRSFTIDFQSRQFILKAASAWGRKFLLLDGAVELGSITPDGFLTRRGRVDLPDDLPLPLTIFIIWLTLIIWKRDSDAAA